MSYTLVLNKPNEFSIPNMPLLKHEESEAYTTLVTFSEQCINLLDQILYNTDIQKEESVPGTEGFFGSIGDFFVTILRVTKRVIQDTASWISKKVKSIFNFRAKQKKYRDQRFEQFKNLHNALTPDKRAEATQRFLRFNIDYTPSFEVYQKMCSAFNTLILEINKATNEYIEQDIRIFGQKKEDGDLIPAWVRRLFDTPVSRDALALFGIRFEDKNFVYHSPFVTLPTLDLASLGYTDLNHVAMVNHHYQNYCWTKMRDIVELRRTFEKHERNFEDRAREMKSQGVNKLDKKDLAASCKSVSSSITLAARLVSYVTQVEEALDTRRGWLIDAGLRACASVDKE